MTKRLSRKRKKVRPVTPTKRRASARARVTAKPVNLAETLVAAGAQALGLPIDPAWRSSIQRNLHLILTHAALVDQFSLPDEIEPAPVFRA